MTNVLYCESQVLVMEADEPTEWVRGNDTELLERFRPLVREQSVVLDFSAVERIDAAGLAALISLYREARDSGHSFAVRNPRAHVGEILALVGLDRVLLAGFGESWPHIGPCLGRNAALLASSSF